MPIKVRDETEAMFFASNDLKKAFSVRLDYTTAYVLRMEMVFCFFDIPMTEAARIMRVSVSLVKRIRAWVHVDQWPCCLVHNGSFGLTREQIVKGRDEVITGLEGETETYGIELALQIMRHARDYAKLYARMVMPIGGRRSNETAVVLRRIKGLNGSGGPKKSKAALKATSVGLVEKSLESGKIGKLEKSLESGKIGKLEESPEVEAENLEVCWPVENDNLNYTFRGSVYGVDGLCGVDDVLGLGPPNYFER